MGNSFDSTRLLAQLLCRTKPQICVAGKIEQSLVCFVLTFTVFHVVLTASRSSAVLLYSLGSNLLFLVLPGKTKNGAAMPDLQPVSTNSKSYLP